MSERAARMCLASIIEPGHQALSEAVREFGAETVWSGLLSGADGPLRQRARRVDPAQLAARTSECGQRFVIPDDPEWPPRLGDLDTCEPVQRLTGEPLGLWVLGEGDVAGLAESAVAIVGSRASTPYGDQMASDLAAELSEAGRVVVSGGAYGIDAAAHRGALAGRTPTIAVLAGGLDQPYPAGHVRLFEHICGGGVLISELPPGEHPTRVRFLARNRLIAALSQATVIVEAAARSGARNTITWANALGRVAMAVPGPATSANSVTPHRLIRDAEAVLVTSSQQILELLSPLRASSTSHAGEHRATDDLTRDELRLFEAVPARGSISAAELALRAGLAMPTCLALLNQLAESCFISQDDDGRWRLQRDRPVRSRP